MIEIPELTAVDVAFGNIKHLPKMEDIPEEFKDLNQDNKWTRAQSEWFFRGIDFKRFIPKEGVDKEKALRALKAIQCSWEPQHEHKRAGVAYLMSEWFSEIAPADKGG